MFLLQWAGVHMLPPLVSAVRGKSINLFVASVILRYVLCGRNYLEGWLFRTHGKERYSLPHTHNSVPRLDDMCTDCDA